MSDSLPVDVRLMLPDEVSAALSLIWTSVRSLNAADYTSEQVEKIVDSYHPGVLSGGTIVVAVHQSQLVGVAKMRPDGFGGRLIEAVFTHPDYVRQGIGRALLTELECSAHRRKAKQMMVFSSLTAVSFYEAMDYQRGHAQRILGDVDVVVLRKPMRAKTMVDAIRQTVTQLLMLVGIVGVLYVIWVVIRLLLS